MAKQQKQARRKLRAKTGFLLPADEGHSRGLAVKGGTIVDADNPIVRGREHLFEPLDDVDDVARAVEKATAAPGELRNLSTVKPPKGA